MSELNHPPITTKGWTLENVIARGRNFRTIPIVDVSHLQDHEIKQLVEKHEQSGFPLLMKGFHKRSSWDNRKFSPAGLREMIGQSRISVRNVYNRKDQDSSVSAYLDYAATASRHASAGETERLYAKDAPCPDEWYEWMTINLPDYLLPFGIGDVSSYLSAKDRVETLMTYLGVGDTYTPAHKDSCASVGQNLMVYTTQGASSFWFLTSRDDSYKASMYWRSLGQELDLESHVATVEQLAKADFPIYVCEQRLGSFVIVPPQSCHQVLNSGGLTMKLSWSRMTPQSFTRSLTYELPIYQRVCRPEIYRVRATIAAVIARCTQKLPSGREMNGLNNSPFISLLQDFLPLYQQMLIESYDPHWKSYPVRSLDGESCDCCGADIWQSAMVCNTCVPPTEENSDNTQPGLMICSPCYVDGRSCRCKNMQPLQACPFNEVLAAANKAVVHLRTHQRPEQTKTLKELKEKDLISEIHPPYFRVANFIHRYRASKTSSQMRVCNLNRSQGTDGKHPVEEEGGIYCDGCHTRACWYHNLEKYNAHIITVATLSPDYKDLQQKNLATMKVNAFKSNDWHQFHKGRDPVTHSNIPFGDTWEEWLPRLAWLFRSSRTLNESVLLGWYDLPALSVGDGGGSSKATITYSTLPDEVTGNESSDLTEAPEYPKKSTPGRNVIRLPAKRKASADIIANGSPHKKPRPSRPVRRGSASSVDEISVFQPDQSDGDSTDEINTPFRSKLPARFNAKQSHTGLPFPPHHTSTSVVPPSPSQRVPSTSKTMLQGARTDGFSTNMSQNPSLEHKVAQLKKELEQLKAERELERKRAETKDHETRMEIGRIWAAVESFRARASMPTDTTPS